MYKTTAFLFTSNNQPYDTFKKAITFIVVSKILRNKF